MKQAAVAVISRIRNGIRKEYVGVSRREDPNDWNLPGGKLDAGETPEQAVVREVFEETGLKVDILRKLSVDVVYSDFEVHTFECVLAEPAQEIKPREGEGCAMWCSAAQVCSGRFGIGNKKRLEAANVVPPCPFRIGDDRWPIVNPT